MVFIKMLCERLFLKTEIFVFVLLLAAGCKAYINLESLPSFQLISATHQFKSVLYIKAAIALQAMGSERAYKAMMAIAQHDENADEIFVLCRMLYMRQDGVEFRRPELGGASFLGGTQYSDWPLEPIAIINGVPFVIVWGYSGAGLPPSPGAYLFYCHSNCAWSSFKYTEKTQGQLNAALKELVASAKWKKPLERQEFDILNITTIRLRRMIPVVRWP